MLSLCDRLGVPEVTDVRATSLTTLAHMAAGGLGITLLPAMAARSPVSGPEDDAGLRVVPFRGPAPSRTIALAHRRGSSRIGELRELARILRDRSPRGAERL